MDKHIFSIKCPHDETEIKAQNRPDREKVDKNKCYRIVLFIALINKVCMKGFFYYKFYSFYTFVPRVKIWCM